MGATASTTVKSVTKTTNVQFYTISEFKSLVGLPQEKASVVRNPKTGSLFLSIGSKNYKCQQNIDGSKEMKVLVEDNNLDLACLVNVTVSNDNTLFEL